jgi:pimeloyl-ACP methyl ester carboxylesterase
MSTFWSAEYWAHKGDVKLYMYRKRVAEPATGEAALPVLFLVHGSSFSARSGFDLQVPGKPGTSEDGIADALADAELGIRDEVPTGTYFDMCANLPVCDPTKIQCPTLIVRGEHDGIATEADVLAYYDKLPVSDKQFVVVPGQAHVSFLGRNRARFLHVVRNFLEMPGRLDG